MASLAAAPRCDDNSKPSLKALEIFPASVVDGVLLTNSYLYLECELDRIIDGFGNNSLIAGRVVAAQVSAKALRTNERNDQDVLKDSPLMVFLPPARYSKIEESFSARS